MRSSAQSVKKIMRIHPHSLPKTNTRLLLYSSVVMRIIHGMKMPSKKTRKTALNITMPPELIGELKALSEETGISVSRMLLDAGRQYAKQLRAQQELLASASSLHPVLRALPIPPKPPEA
jgi:hypothetical protein